MLQAPIKHADDFVGEDGEKFSERTSHRTRILSPTFLMSCSLPHLAVRHHSSRRYENPIGRQAGKQTANIRHDGGRDLVTAGWCGGWQNCPMESDLGSTGRHGQLSLVPAGRVGFGGPNAALGCSLCRVRPAFSSVRTLRHELINQQPGQGSQENVPGHEQEECPQPLTASSIGRPC